MARVWLGIAVAILLTITVYVGTPITQAAEVNVYSARKEELIKPLLDKFTAETNIKVNLVTAEADTLVERLKTEGSNSPADILITTDAGRLERAKAAGVLQPAKSDALNKNVPPQYREPAGYWYGLSVRARPVLYVKGKVDPKSLSTYEALADPQWKGRICIRSSDSIYNQSMVAAMIANLGVEKTEAWAKGLVANFAQPPKGGDRDQVKAAAAGICDIAIANTYYLAMMLKDKDKATRDAGEKMGVFFPNQADRGAHVNISGAGVTKAAKHAADATKLIEFLTSDASQGWYAETNNEYPIRDAIPWSQVLKDFGQFKADNLELAKLGEFNAEAVKLMDRAGWK